MAVLERVNFTGASGTVYQFTAYTTDSTFTTAGGVYIFTKRQTSGGTTTYTPLYIGQTQSVKDRLEGHQKWPCAQRNGVDSICVYWETNSSTRLNIETDLLRRFSPVCND